MSLPPVDTLLSSARLLAEKAAWDDLIRLLEPAASRPTMSDELSVLFGEALTRARREIDAQQWLRPVVSRLAHGTDSALHRRAVNLLGVSCFRVGDLDQAAEAFTAALELATEASDSLTIARASNNLGMIANMRGHCELALSYYRRAIPTYQRNGHAQGLAETYHNIAITFRDLEQLDEADAHEQRTIAYASAGQVPRLVVMGHIGRGEIALRRGDPELAIATAQHAVRELGQLRDPLNEADAWRLLACALCQADRLDDSREAFARALSLARTHGHVFNEAETLRDRMRLWVRMLQRSSALNDGAASLALFRRLGATREVEALTRRIKEVRGAPAQ